MTRAPTRQVATAMKLLDGRGRTEIECAVLGIKYICDWKKFYSSDISKETKRKLRSLISAYGRAQIVQKQLPWAYRRYFKIDFKPLITRAEELVAAKVSPPKRDATKAHAAVEAAYDLLRWFGYPVTVTRGGKWHQLSAVLYGEQDADLYRHLCAYRNAAKTRTGS